MAMARAWALPSIWMPYLPAAFAGCGWRRRRASKSDIERCQPPGLRSLSGRIWPEMILLARSSAAMPMFSCMRGTFRPWIWTHSARPRPIFPLPADLLSLSLHHRHRHGASLRRSSHRAVCASIWQCRCARTITGRWGPESCSAWRPGSWRGWTRAMQPMLTHVTDHYVRTYLRVIKGAKAADKCLENLGYVEHCPSCGSFVLLRARARGHLRALPGQDHPGRSPVAGQDTGAERSSNGFARQELGAVQSRRSFLRPAARRGGRAHVL